MVIRLIAVYSHVCNQDLFFQTHLPKVLSCVRFLSAMLLHLLNILQLQAVTVSELWYRDWKEYFVMEESKVSVLCLCVHKNKTSLVNTRKGN
jgi:hypothetical protein